MKRKVAFVVLAMLVILSLSIFSVRAASSVAPANGSSGNNNVATGANDACLEQIANKQEYECDKRKPIFKKNISESGVTKEIEVKNLCVSCSYVKDKIKITGHCVSKGKCHGDSSTDQNGKEKPLSDPNKKIADDKQKKGELKPVSLYDFAKQSQLGQKLPTTEDQKKKDELLNNKADPKDTKYFDKLDSATKIPQSNKNSRKTDNPNKFDSSLLADKNPSRSVSKNDRAENLQQALNSKTVSPKKTSRSGNTFSDPKSSPTSMQPKGGVIKRITDGAKTVMASYYGHGRDEKITVGRPTASGQIFDPNKNTFALPLGSGRKSFGLYQVCSQSTCLTARANDFGNFGPGNKYSNRGVDLSYGLYRALGGGGGLLRVSITPIKWNALTLRE